MANPFTSRSAPAMMPSDWQTQQNEIDYQRKLAAQLEGDTQMPQGGMVGQVYVAPSWTQMLSKALNPAIARSRRDEANRMAKALAGEQQAERMGTLDRFSKAMQGTPEMPMGPPTEAGDMGVQPAVPGNRNAAMAALGRSRDPMLQQLYMAQMLKEPDKPVVVGRSLLDPRTGKQVGIDSTWQGEQQATREAKDAEARAKREADAARALADRELRRELAGQASADRRMIAGMVNARQEQKNVPKLPTSALKMQQEELDAIGTSSTINADLAAIGKQLESGKLNLGLVSNLMGKAKNLVGASDEQSRNLASFQATLEKLRNDSLRLNKGVQTEGDAQRAWNELVANINDPGVVKQRLGEIQKINERAANLRRMNVDNIRTNFGVDPMDTTGYSKQPAAIGGGGGGADVDALVKKYGG